ncbi:hypothetical protein LENED_006796 [Lentinula edodes]|uniref:Uncharacterized protein n=1 Tax=Lentinula edodes TaxID=5353 RepID=A0A1Q3ECS6_LENED|nr:hypothetical protein LENED_006796 [Lentinula edodes]
MNLEVHVSTHSYDSRSLGRDSDIFEKNHYKSYTYLPESFDTTLQESNEYVVVEGLSLNTSSRPTLAYIAEPSDVGSLKPASGKCAMTVNLSGYRYSYQAQEVVA